MNRLANKSYEAIRQEAKDYAKTHNLKLTLSQTKVANFYGFKNFSILRKYFDKKLRSKKGDIMLEQLNNIKKNLKNIREKKVSSKEMHEYVNSLNQEEYSTLATAFIIGRQNWDRGVYQDTNECTAFIEENEACGIKTTYQMLDEKFLTKKERKKQYDLTYQMEKNDAIKIDDSYNHNWLSSKTNLITETEKGIKLIEDLI